MLPTLLSSSAIPIAVRDLDDAEQRYLDWFSSQGCSCALGPDDSLVLCSVLATSLCRHEGGLAQLTREEKDILLMGQIMAMSKAHSLSTLLITDTLHNRGKDLEQPTITRA